MRFLHRTIRLPFRALAGAAFAAGLLAAPAMAQSSPTSAMQHRILEEQTRPLMQPDLRSAPSDDRFQYDFGGMLRSQALWYQDFGPDFSFLPGAPKYQGSRAVFDWDFRPWLSMSLDKIHYGYIRGQFDFLQYGAGDGFDKNSDWRGPFVDIGFYRLDVDEAFRQYCCGTADNWSGDLTIGRQFLYVGRGLAFALTTDAVSYDWQCGDWGGLAFLSQSVRHFDNIDRGAPSFEHSTRHFAGVQLDYERWDHHKPYGFIVVQRDRTGETPENPLQDFDYDSEYYGLGIKGETLFGEGQDAAGIQNLAYFGEFIVERGRSFGIGSETKQDPIRAWAMDTGLIYYMPGRTKPRFMVEYARASGDRDRFSPSNTTLGNTSGTDDHGFLGFGFLNTGFSFAPQFANLQFVRLAAAYRPFEECCEWRTSNLEIGTSLYFYWRSDEHGGVSDLRADTSGRKYLGSEVDFFLNWRISSDLYFLTNYGIFSPEADSFTVNRTRQFLSFNLTWLF